MRELDVHFADSDTIAKSIVRFAHLARDHELNVGLQETQEALAAASLGLITDKPTFKYALKSIFCCCEEDGELFDDLFHEYWLMGVERDKRIRYKKTISHIDQPVGSVVMMGKGDTIEGEEKDAKVVTGANRTERLRKTDFAAVADIDSDHLNEIIEQLVKQMAARITRRMKRAKHGHVNIRSTIRRNMGRGGNLIELVHENRRKEKPGLVVLLDASGSMDKYSFYLLRFVYELRSAFRSVESFVFSTTLTRITEHLKTADVREVLTNMSQHVHNWSSGTRMGESLRQFNQGYAKRVLNGRSVVIILSDGLDTGDPQLLASQLAMIKQRTKRLIWLNPLKGSDQYQPLARGMAAALPEIDTFASAHNLNSLLKLEKFLSDV